MEETVKEIATRHKDEAISIALLGQKLVDFRELMLEKLSKQDLMLANIEKQTVKTNGSVAKTIEDINTLNYWKNRIIGGLILSNVVVVPILMWLIYKHLDT